jgi:hypothetical protein
MSGDYIEMQTLRKRNKKIKDRTLQDMPWVLEKEIQKTNRKKAEVQKW